jgi:hypothetical protein
MKPHQAVIILVILVGALVALSNQGGRATNTGVSPSPSQSWYERLQDPSYRESFAGLGMKQANYLRDPGSLVIESTGGCSRRNIGRTDWLVFACHYRAKNGLGGYTPGVAWVLCDPDNGSFRIMSEAQYSDFWQTEDATPAATEGKHQKHT